MSTAADPNRDPSPDLYGHHVGPWSVTVTDARGNTTHHVVIASCADEAAHLGLAQTTLSGTDAEPLATSTGRICG